jgi:hypothetical protein
VNSAVHTVEGKRRKFASGDRHVKEIMCERNFVHVSKEGVCKKNIKEYRILTF